MSRRPKIDRKPVFKSRQGRSLQGPVFSAFVASQQAGLLGRLGEEFIHKMMPELFPAKVGQEGFDFIRMVFPSKARIEAAIKLGKAAPIQKKFVEVKTLSPDESVSGKIFLEFRQGHWSNQTADELYVVSVHGVWKASAADLRNYLSNHINQFPSLKKISLHKSVWVEISFKALLDKGILHRANIPENRFHDFLVSKMGKVSQTSAPERFAPAPGPIGRRTQIEKARLVRERQQQRLADLAARQVAAISFGPNIKVKAPRQSKPDYDLILEIRQRGKVRYEKLMFFYKRDSDLAKDRFVLPIWQSDWENKTADRVVVASSKGIWTADAKKLRDFVKRVMQPLFDQRRLSATETIRIPISLSSMLSDKVLTTLNIDPKWYSRTLESLTRDLG